VRSATSPASIIPKKLMAFLGVIPGEDSSGQTRRQGPITKCGNTHARWMLIECAAHYRMMPKISKALSKRQEGLSREVRASGLACTEPAQQTLVQALYAQAALQQDPGGRRP
jgi:transposase